MMHQLVLSYLLQNCHEALCWSTMAPSVQPLSEEYRVLVDKAYNKFARLREFPQYGRNKWDFYFHKAFQVGVS